MATIEALPNELLIAILSLVDPATPFRHRPCSTLYASCLVSRRWRECAQPLLWSALDTKSLTAVVREAKAGGHVRTLQVEGADCRFEAARLAPLLSLPSLADARVSTWTNGPQLAELFPLLTNLHGLILYKTNFLSCTTPSPFPTLVSLTIHNAFVRPAFLESLLRPQHIPHLRLLLLGQLYEGFSNRFFPSLDEPLLRQLDMLQLEVEDTKYRPFQYDDSTPILVSVALLDQPRRLLAAEAANLPLQHLHLRTFIHDPLPPSSPDRYNLENAAAHTRRDHLFTLANTLPSSLSILVLPAVLRSPFFQSALATLRDACAKKEIAVLWEEVPHGQDDGLWLSEEFHRWVLEKRRGK
ncbi:hypothetical protein JCM6882_004456 [Rhodosporidiobolus microsporus]